MSTYAEFMGMYSPKDYPAMETKDKNLFSEKALPTLKIRKGVKESTMKAVIDGFSMIPVYSYIPNSPFDHVNQFGCSYVQ
jgi:hypothetical protein